MLIEIATIQINKFSIGISERDIFTVVRKNVYVFENLKIN